MALSVGAIAACNSSGTNGNGDGGNGDGGNGDGGNGGPPFTITVMRAGTGSGKVTSQPAGISCDGTGSCSAMFPGGTTVTLTAQGQGAAFSGWTGACAGQSAACQLSPTGDVSTTASFDPLSCTQDSICWEAPLPFGMDLNSVFALAPNDVWAVGTAGTTVHYNGTSWRRVQTSTQNSITDVWARSASEVWATGGTGSLMLRYDGTNWSNVTIPGTYTTLRLYGASPNLLFVTTVGRNVLHYNGTNWQARDAGDRAVTLSLQGVTGSSGSDVWVWDDDCGKTHWNGSAWASLAPHDGTWCPTGLVSLGTNNAYALSAMAKLYRYTGGSNFTGGTTVSGIGVAGLWGTSGNSLFTSGSPGILNRFDGTSWSAIQTPAREAGTFNRIHGTSGTDVWAVGDRGSIVHYDGSTATASRANVFSGDIVGTFGLGSSNIYFVTNNRTLVHYDGISYTETPSLITGNMGSLQRMWGTAADDLWLVGSDASNKPMILHNTGQGFMPTNIDPDVGVIDPTIATIYAGSKTVVWAGPSGLKNPLKWDGTTFQIDFTLNTNGSIRALWGTSANDVWLAADTAVHRHNGTMWINTGLNADIYSFGGLSASDVWAGGFQAVRHWNGSVWSAAMTVTGSVGPIVSVSATAANDVWFVDSTSQVFRYNGSTFTRLNTSLGSLANKPMFSYAADANNVWFGGRGILSYRR